MATKKMNKVQQTARTLTTQMLSAVSNIFVLDGAEVEAKKINKQTREALIRRDVARIKEKGPKNNRVAFIQLTVHGKKVATFIKENAANA